MLKVKEVVYSEEIVSEEQAELIYQSLVQALKKGFKIRVILEELENTKESSYGCSGRDTYKGYFLHIVGIPATLLRVKRPVIIISSFTRDRAGFKGRLPYLYIKNL